LLDCIIINCLFKTLYHETNFYITYMISCVFIFEVLTDVSEEHTDHLLNSTVKMEAVGSSKTSVNAFKITRRINPEDQHTKGKPQISYT